MTRRIRTLVCLALAAALLAALASSSAAAPPMLIARAPIADQLAVVVLAPYLTWDDISPSRMPNLARVAAEGAVANMNVSSGLSRQQGNVVGRSALALSAGMWADADARALPPANVDETITGSSAEVIYERLVGGRPQGRIVHLGLPRESEVNTDAGAVIALGTLGQAVKDAGGTTVAYGNSDPGRNIVAHRRARPAGVIAMDREGRVDEGVVSTDLLNDDPGAPFGVRTHRRRLLEGMYGPVDRPTLVVLDTGDLERSHAFSADASPEAAERARVEALSGLDGLIGDVVANRESRDGRSHVMLLVVPLATAPLDDRSHAFAPVVVHGGGKGVGVLTSSSTHRRGLVTLLDVNATILEHLGIERPVQVVGNAMSRVSDGLTFEERVEVLSAAERTAAAVDLPKGYMQAGYIVAAVIVFLVAALMLVRTAVGRRRGMVLRALILLVLSMPAAGTLMFVASSRPATVVEVVALFAVTTLVVWALALVMWRFEGAAAPVAVVSGLTVAVLLLDQWLGGPWSFTGLFSFSPVLGARYYGMGNEQASMLVGALLVAAALTVDLAPSRVARHLRMWAFPVLGMVAVFTVAAPFLGANVGVAIWGTIAVGVAWAGMNGRRIGWKAVLAMLAAVIVLIAAFSFIDLGGGGAQTHLGRAWDSAGKGGLIELWTIASRKAETNLRVLTRTNWSYLLVVILGLLAYMRARPQGAFRDTLETYPAFAAAMTAGLVGGLFGYLTEDSGIVIPALVMLYVGGAVLYLMLGRGSAPEGER